MKFIQNSLLIILILSIALVILINFVLNDIPEKINIGYEIGVVINAVSLSYIAAYIFYLFQTLIPLELQKRQNLIALKSPIKNINDNINTLWNVIDIKFDEENLNDELTIKLKTKGMAEFSTKIRTIINNEIIYYKHCELINAVYLNLNKEMVRINQLNTTDLELNLLLDKLANADLFKYNETFLNLHYTSNFMPIGNGYIHLFEAFISDYKKFNIHIQYILDFNN